MARYRGPRVKICRALGDILPGLTNKKTLEKPYRPGQHGQNRTSKASDYKERLIEKQKLRYHFGLLEKQFKKYISEAVRRKGPTGENLVSLLESRLDNVVWRLGLAPTIPAARQLVVHGHILVNGKKVDRPSYQTSLNQVISIRQKSIDKPAKNAEMNFMKANLELASHRVRPKYLELDVAKGVGTVIGVPEKGDLPFNVDTQKIIEFYSQQL
jgi:small subunit ribosomal protein S4